MGKTLLFLIISIGIYLILLVYINILPKVDIIQLKEHNQVIL